MRFALRLTFLLALALALGGMSYAGSTAAASQMVEARRTQEHIRLDGRLDEPAWRDASMAVELVQQSPHPGAETSHHRRWRFETENGFGTFYSGHLLQWLNRLNWTSPKGAWQVGLEATNNFARLREGNFVQRLWQLEFSRAWGPNVVLTSFIQYDTESQNIGANTRLRWTIKPGRDLFLVWNRGWEHLLNRPDLTLRPDSEFLAVKLRWTFRE